jgi:hypothetical protein
MTLFALAVLDLIGMESVVAIVALSGDPPPRNAEDARMLALMVIIWPVLWAAIIVGVWNAIRPIWENQFR